MTDEEPNEPAAQEESSGSGFDDEQIESMIGSAGDGDISDDDIPPEADNL
ncbi:MAG TPA: hypothetical protein VGQ00_01770 [Candidatus Norongarragalinales archaeon]|jgi:hypothetical protein|nr:hypothetical protein [Candidatus Norongarragalinales archaeon]